MPLTLKETRSDSVNLNYQVDERSGMRDETSSDEFSNEDGQVRSDSHHAVLQVLVQLAAVFLNFDNLKE